MFLVVIQNKKDVGTSSEWAKGKSLFVACGSFQNR